MKIDHNSIIIIITALGLVLAYVTYNFNKSRNECDENKQSGVMLTELGYIKSGIDDIKKEQSQQREQHIEVVTRLTAVEQSAKQAHKRLDQIEGKEKKNEH